MGIRLIWLGIIGVFGGLMLSSLYAASPLTFEQLAQFDLASSFYYQRTPQSQDLAGVWEPSVSTPSQAYGPRGIRNEKTLHVPFEKLALSKDGSVQVRDVALSSNPGATFRCRLSRSKDTLVCKSPCGSYFRIYERGMMGTQASSLSD